VAGIDPGRRRGRGTGTRAAIPAFLDTAYVYALVDTRDGWHEAAMRRQRQLALERRRLLTTEFVLVEVANGLAAVRFRAHADRVITVLMESPLVEVVPASTELFAAALALFRQRADKAWGLTDCTSFVVMGERGLSDALTTDEHFRQAGFQVLMLETSD